MERETKAFITQVIFILIIDLSPIKQPLSPSPSLAQFLSEQKLKKRSKTRTQDLSYTKLNFIALIP